MEEIKFMNTKQVAQALGCSMPTAKTTRSASRLSLNGVKKEEFNDLK